MSDLAYLIAKGLPSALRAIPKGGVMSNPYIAGRVVAHDRGTAAGTLIGHAKKYEARAVVRYPKPTKKRIVLAPPLALRDVALRHDSMNTVRSTMASAERVKTQGKQARRFSREHLGKGLDMSEQDYLISKGLRATDPQRERNKKNRNLRNAAIGAGGGAALYGGAVKVGGSAETMAARALHDDSFHGPNEFLNEKGKFRYRDYAHRDYPTEHAKWVEQNLAPGNYRPRPSDAARYKLFHRGLKRNKVAVGMALTGAAGIAASPFFMGGAGVRAARQRGARKRSEKGVVKSMSEREYLIDKAYRGIGGKPSKGLSEEAKKLLLKRANSRSTRLIPPGLVNPRDMPLASRQFSTRRPPPSISKAAATKDHPKGEYRASIVNRFPGKREKGLDTYYRRGTVIRRNARAVGLTEGHAVAGAAGAGALGAGIGAGVGRLSHIGARRGAEWGGSAGVAAGGLTGQLVGQAKARNRTISSGDVKLIARGGPNKGKRVKRHGFFKPVFED